MNKGIDRSNGMMYRRNWKFTSELHSQIVNSDAWNKKTKEGINNTATKLKYSSIKSAVFPSFLSFILTW